VLRVVLAIVFARTLADGCWHPLIAFALAAASDYVDGPIARRAGGPTRYGALLDSMADIVFVLVASTAGAVTGRLSWAAPAAIVCAAVPYLVTMIWQRRPDAGAAPAYSAIGHAAGVSNYALVGLLAGSVARPWPHWPFLLDAATAVVVALNLAAVALRFRRQPNRSVSS
jgi:phosphatidylglycerophosphate synthase